MAGALFQAIGRPSVGVFIPRPERIRSVTCPVLAGHRGVGGRWWS